MNISLRSLHVFLILVRFHFDEPKQSLYVFLFEFLVLEPFTYQFNKLLIQCINPTIDCLIQSLHNRLIFYRFKCFSSWQLFNTFRMRFHTISVEILICLIINFCLHGNSISQRWKNFIRRTQLNIRYSFSFFLKSIFFYRLI